MSYLGAQRRNRARDFWKLYPACICKIGPLCTITFCASLLGSFFFLKLYPGTFACGRASQVPTKVSDSVLMNKVSLNAAAKDNESSACARKTTGHSFAPNNEFVIVATETKDRRLYSWRPLFSQQWMLFTPLKDWIRFYSTVRILSVKRSPTSMAAMLCQWEH